MTKKSVFGHFMICLMLLWTPVYGYTPGELDELIMTGSLFGHSTNDVRNRAKNKQYVVPQDSHATVIESKRMRHDGSYALKIKITSLPNPAPKGSPPIGTETWVYYSQKSPWLTLLDKANQEVQDPEIALAAKAIKDSTGLSVPEEQIHVPTKAEVLNSQKELAPETPENPKCPELQNPPGKLEPLPPTVKKEISLDAFQSEQNWSQFPEIQKYSNSAQVDQAIKYGLRNKEKRTNRLCYRYVKRALFASDLVSSYPPGRYARNGVSDLKRQGFKNLLEDPKYKGMIRSPKHAPKGAVLVYENIRNPRHPGHIEIKTDWGTNGGYVAELYRSGTTEIYQRRLIGVMIKDPL